MRNTRIFYDVVETEVHILAIVSKEEAEDWLREAGSEKLKEFLFMRLKTTFPGTCGMRRRRRSSLLDMASSPGC